MSIELDLAGRVVLVTGGAKGVGAGISELFLRAGADVEVCGRSTPAETPSAGGRTATFTSTDVRDEQQVALWVEDVVQRHGRIDVVVNNAGGAPFAEFASASTRFHRKITELNFLAAAWVAQAAFPVMNAQDSGGVVINITSISARRASPGTAV